MTQETFINKKEKIKRFATEEKESVKTDSNSRQSIETLLTLLDKYNYDNRLEIKGLLTRTIIDSLEINYSIGEKFIQFDDSII